MNIQRHLFSFIAVVTIALLFSCSSSKSLSNPAVSSANPGTEQRDSQRRLLGKLDREDKVAAVALARQLIDQGDPMAMAYLGARHLDGSNVPKDRVKADELFERASKLGDAEVDFLIGKTFAHCRCEGNKKAAFDWYSRAASRGHLVATFDLGGMYELGFGVPKDAKKAFAQFLKAAELGHPKAMSKVAESYSKGVGVKRSESLAKEWSGKASAAVIKQSLPKQ